MEAFVNRHREQVLGVLSGFDRVLFRGTLRSISYVKGARKFLSAKNILLKDFAAFAEQCTQALVAHAQHLAETAGRPYVYLTSSSVRKEDVAREIAERDGITRGLVAVLYAVEPCMAFDIYRNRKTKRLELVSRQRKCRFFYFYYMDREFGLMHVRLQSWFPFEVQVCLNGRSYLASQLDREGIPYERRGNCFPRIGDLPRAQELIDRLERRDWAKTLSVLAERVNPLRHTLLRGVHGYYWSVRQCEYATDVLFRTPAALAAVYPSLWQHAMSHFATRDVMRFLGKRMTRAFRGEAASDMKRRPEGVRVKHAVHGNSIKMYDKEGTVLRIETTITNPRWFRVLRRVPRQGRPALAWLPMRLGVSDIARRAEVSRRANARYLEALSVVGEPTPSHRLLDPVSQPVRKGRHRYRALRPVSPEEATLFEGILRGEHLLRGFRNRDVQAHLFPTPATDPDERRRRCAHVCRRLRLLRAHGLVRKVPGRRLYRITSKGHRIMTTALRFRQADTALLATPRVA